MEPALLYTNFSDAMPSPKLHTHLQALSEVGGGHANALPIQARVPHDCHSHLDARGVLQLGR